MSTCRLFRLIAAGGLLLLATTPPRAYGDPVTVRITSGSLVYQYLNDASVDLRFPNGSTFLHWSVTEGDAWAPDYFFECCTAGRPLNLSTDETFPDPLGQFGGELRLGADTYSVSSFTTSAVALRDINVPNLQAEEYRLFTVPFEFQGTMSGTTADQRSMVLRMIGTGDATVILEGLGDGRAQWFRTNYEFQADVPAPVPEPATLLLVATGLVTTARVASRRRRLEDSKCTVASSAGVEVSR